jgi:hypothetical protein
MRPSGVASVDWGDACGELDFLDHIVVTVGIVLQDVEEVPYTERAPEAVVDVLAEVVAVVVPLFGHLFGGPGARELPHPGCCPRAERQPGHRFSDGSLRDE